MGTLRPMKRISCIKVYFTEEEAELLRQRAGLASLSAYVRAMALTPQPSVLVAPVIPEAVKITAYDAKRGKLTVERGNARKREKAEKKAKLQGTRCPHGMAIVDGLTGCNRCNS